MITVSNAIKLGSGGTPANAVMQRDGTVVVQRDGQIVTTR